MKCAKCKTVFYSLSSFYDHSCDVQPGDKESSKINHPSHYRGDTTYEAIKVIEAWGLGFCDGNAVKYICRHSHKGASIEDLKKARWYLDRLIVKLEESKG